MVGQVLQQASTVTTGADITLETLDYIISLREGIMDAWGGILLSYKGTPQGMYYSALACILAYSNGSQSSNCSRSSSRSSSFFTSSRKTLAAEVKD